MKMHAAFDVVGFLRGGLVSRRRGDRV